ncbi:response regulator [Flavobacterium sp. TMP13]|uniref:response regulator n=1 Tax=Flavobacterium sp. TMP13 TaxID=3425950 RepID=UPI003D77CD2C
MYDTILCIDDDPIALLLCKKVITRFDFSKEIVTAQNGEEALQYFNGIKYGTAANRKKPQLIFLDLNMPVMGGWEFLDHFIESDYNQFNTIPVVVLSSTIDPQDVEKSKEYPIIIDFLSKPITIDILNYLSEKILKNK